MGEKGNPPKTQYRQAPEKSLSESLDSEKEIESGVISPKTEYVSNNASIAETHLQKGGHFVEGDQIGHNYTVIHRLGEGASGSVYKVRSGLGEIEALKIAPPELLGTSVARKNFIQELKAARQLHHPNLVPVHNVEFIPGSEAVFFTMAYMQGGDLGRKLEAEEKGLPLNEVLKWMGQVAEALAYVHKEGLVHQDIKPANILLNEKGEAFLGDFGLAFKYMSDCAKERMSQTTRAGGTSYFMSPEQQQAIFFGRKSSITAASDVCAFGLTLYALISGEFISGRPEPMSEFIKDGEFASHLDHFLDQCWARKPEKRFPDGAGLVQAFKFLCDGSHANGGTPVSAIAIEVSQKTVPKLDLAQEKKKERQAKNAVKKKQQSAQLLQREAERIALKKKRHHEEQAILQGRCLDTSKISETNLAKMKYKHDRFIKLLRKMDSSATKIQVTGEADRLKEAINQEKARLAVLRPGKMRKLLLVLATITIVLIVGIFIGKKVIDFRKEKSMVAYVLEYRSLGSCDRYFEVYGRDGYFFDEITKLRMEAIFLVTLEDWTKWEPAGAARRFELPGTKVFMHMHWVPAGRFQVGSSPGLVSGDNSKGLHEVEITDGFWMGETEVTQLQWQAVMGPNPSFFKGLNKPVDQVSWEEVQLFLHQLNTSSRGWKFALPTEAQWEYACLVEQADTAELETAAWYAGNSGSMTHEVNQKKANALGLHDMRGNVWEWCQDWLEDYPSGTQPGPKGKSSATIYRVIRGGGWGDTAESFQTVSRHGISPEQRGNHIGFRMVFHPRTKKQ